MPKLNARGQAVMGVGDGVVSVDKRPLIYRAGAACWLDPETILANARQVTGRWQVERCRVADGQVDPMVDPPDGANELVGGGGRWLGWNPKRGMFGSLGDKPAAGVIAAGRDGTLAYCRNRQIGRGFVLNAPDGREMEVGSAIVYDLQVLGPTSAIWWDGREVEAVGRPLPRFACPPGRTRLVTIDGEDWLVYWSEDVGLIAHPDGATDGYVLETRPIAFNHDAVAIDGLLVVAWSTTQGEGPNDLVVKIISRQKPRAPLVSMPVIGRACWLGFFEFGGLTSGLPGNCYLFVGPDMLVQNYAGQIVAQYVSSQPEGDIDALERALLEAGHRWPGVPRLAYWTRGPQAGRVPAGAEMIGIEAYRGIDETLVAFERRVRFAVAQCPRAWLIAQAYSSNTSLTTDLVSLIPVYARIARDCPNVEGILVFSAGARATGWSDHPEVQDGWRSLADGLAGTPAVPPAPDSGSAPSLPSAPDPTSSHHPTPPPKEAPVNPSLNAWITEELPQLLAAYRANPANKPAMDDDPHAPHAEWGAFQTYRRYVEGWSFAQMLTHEQTQGATPGTTPEPP